MSLHKVWVVECCACDAASVVTDAAGDLGGAALTKAGAARIAEENGWRQFAFTGTDEWYCPECGKRALADHRAKARGKAVAL